ncbi:hypothetical protein T484DRAFT_1790875 [Baffinella frigidus]|nr:hypothetical protein T484DRAFT_1790875 [Cryptophyta sp. CCMP2293]
MGRLLQEAWEDILAGAGLGKDEEWVKNHYYPDGVTVGLVLSAAKKLGANPDDVFEMYGNYFIKYLKPSPSL